MVWIRCITYCVVWLAAFMQLTSIAYAATASVSVDKTQVHVHERVHFTIDVGFTNAQSVQMFTDLRLPKGLRQERFEEERTEQSDDKVHMLFELVLQAEKPGAYPIDFPLIHIHHLHGSVAERLQLPRIWLQVDLPPSPFKNKLIGFQTLTQPTPSWLRKNIWFVLTSLVLLLLSLILLRRSRPWWRKKPPLPTPALPEEVLAQWLQAPVPEPAALADATRQLEQALRDVLLTHFALPQPLPSAEELLPKLATWLPTYAKPLQVFFGHSILIQFQPLQPEHLAYFIEARECAQQVLTGIASTSSTMPKDKS